MFKVEDHLVSFSQTVQYDVSSRSCNATLRVLAFHYFSNLYKQEEKPERCEQGEGMLAKQALKQNERHTTSLPLLKLESNLIAPQSNAAQHNPEAERLGFVPYSDSLDSFRLQGI